MKKICLLLALMLALMCGIAMAAAEAPAAEDALVGTWALEKVQRGGEESTAAQSGITLVAVLNADGSAVLNTGETYTGTWSTDGAQVVVTVPGNTAAFDYDGANLSMMIGKMKLVLSKTEMEAEPAPAATPIPAPAAADDALVGTWALEKVLRGDEESTAAESGITMIAVLNADGSAALTTGETYTGTWSKGDAQVVVTVPGNVATFDYDGVNLSMMIGRMKLVLAKADPNAASAPVATPEPTPIPMAEPTPMPTEEPTPVPTAEPTPVPTEEPTPVPTEEPTPVPTEEPTPVPTAEPTPVPTAEPTPVPTEEPTPVPTTEPTPVPTAEPTPVPTTEPTPMPTAVPGAATVVLNRPDRFFYQGNWTCVYMNGTNPVAEGAVYTLTLNADGTAACEAIAPDGTMVWTYDEQSGGYCCMSGEKQLPMTIMNGAFLVVGTDPAERMVFSHSRYDTFPGFPEEAQPTAAPTAEPTPEPTAEPTATPAPTYTAVPPTEPAGFHLFNAAIGRKFVCTKAVVSGFEMDVNKLGGEYSVILNADHTADLVMAGSKVKNATWTMKEGAFAVYIYGNERTIEVVDGGLVFDFLGMLMTMTPAQK